MKLPEGTELGTLCRRGHDYEGTGQSLRKYGQCLECNRIWKNKNKEYLRQYDRRRRSENPDKFRDQKKSYYQRNKEALTLKAKRYYRENRELILLSRKTGVPISELRKQQGLSEPKE